MALPRKAVEGKGSPFCVPAHLDVLGGLVQHYRNFWIGLGRLESKVHAAELNAISLTMPVFVCGLARSGSTLLHEIVAAHPGVASHRVKDNPMVYTPYWWRRATVRAAPSAPRERPHRDRIFITTSSPDSLEEMVWLAFFPRCHDPSIDNRLGADDAHPAFENFYRAHLRKLLLAECATRYVAKANYHVARLPYLLRVFPDAKLLVPVRPPAGHIASLMRQHRWFSAGQRRHRAALRYMQRTGHFEFGLDRRPMNLGDGPRVRQILSLWAAGEEVRGWARYWDMVYGYLARLLQTDGRLRAATRIVRFEALCDDPTEQIRRVIDHCRLPEADRLVAKFAPTIRRPDYYDSSFTPEEVAIIRGETDATARWWGSAE
jgi:hypothetical protein